MKKVFLILVVLIGFGIGANAQTNASCDVKGTNKTVCGTITSYDTETGSVTIDWSNSSDVTVNVTIKIQWDFLKFDGYKSGPEKTFSFMAKKEDEGSKTFEFSGNNMGDKSRVKITRFECD